MEEQTIVTYDNVVLILKASGVHKNVRTKVAKLLMGHGKGSKTLGQMREDYDRRKKSGTLLTTGGMRAGPKVQQDAEAVLAFIETLDPGKKKKKGKKQK